MRPLLMSFLLNAVSYGQAFLLPNPYPDLKQYLSLTDAQYQSIVRNQSNFGDLVESKQERIRKVNVEIFVETNRESLDAMALGVRYLELEVICREVTDAYARLRTQNMALLTDAQKVKIKDLEDALKLNVVIQQAQSVNLIVGTTGISNSAYFLTGILLPGFSNPTTFPGCRETNIPTAAMLNK